MKPISILICLGVILFSCLLNVNAQAQNDAGSVLPPTKYKIDGSFNDWKSYEIAKAETGIDWSKHIFKGMEEEIHLKEFHYDNDKHYLYVFFKFKPSLQERYDKSHVTAYLNCLYMDTDANTNTGCGKREKEGETTLPGSEIRVEVTSGLYLKDDTSGISVSYNACQWDSAVQKFSKELRTADSTDSVPLIAHGKDGVEIALPLSDLQITKTNLFTISMWGYTPLPSECVNRTIVHLR